MRFASLLLWFLLGVVPLGSAAAEPFVRLAIEGDAVTVQSSDPATGADTPFAIASVGKTFTAVALLRLVDRGAIALDGPAAERLPPEIAALFDGLPGMRLRHLLTMTSGLPDYYTDEWIDDALADPARVQTSKGALLAAAEKPRLFLPGWRFDYSNTNYVLLGVILEHVTGMPYADALETEVFGPAGLTDSFVFGSRPLPAAFAKDQADRALLRRFYSGAGLGDGGVIASARDVARFYRALFIDRSLLSDQLLDAMLKDAAGADYGMGLEIEDGIAGHSGGDLGYSSDVRINLRRGIVAVEFVAAEDAGTDWAWDRVAGP